MKSRGVSFLFCFSMCYFMIIIMMWVVSIESLVLKLSFIIISLIMYVLCIRYFFLWWMVFPLLVRELPKYTVNFENTYCVVTFYPPLINHMCYLIGRIWLDYYNCIYYYCKQMKLQPAAFHMNSNTTMDTWTYYRFAALYILIIPYSASINDLFMSFISHLSSLFIFIIFQHIKTRENCVISN